MTEKQKRELIIKAGKKLVAQNLVQGTWGNISLRLDEEHMLLTPSGLDYTQLTIDDLIIMNINTMHYESPHKPSSEKDLHAVVYQQRKEINAVIHSHPTHCSTIACIKHELPIMHPQMQELIGKSVRVSKYALPSTKKLAKNVSKALKGRNACIIANHGAIAFGNSLEEAFMVIDILEKSAKLYIEKLAKKQIGKEKLSAEIMIDFFLQNKIKNCNKRGRNGEI